MSIPTFTRRTRPSATTSAAPTPSASAEQGPIGAAVHATMVGHRRRGAALFLVRGSTRLRWRVVKDSKLHPADRGSGPHVCFQEPHCYVGMIDDDPVYAGLKVEGSDLLLKRCVLLSQDVLAERPHVGMTSCSQTASQGTSTRRKALVDGLRTGVHGLAAGPKRRLKLVRRVDGVATEAARCEHVERAFG